MSSIFNNVRILGNLDVKGTTTSISSETVLISDNHFLLNSGYTLAAGQTGGVVVNYKAVADGVVVAGFDSTTTVNAVGLTLVTGDYIQVSGARTAANNGLYEVSSYADPVLTIKTTGVNDFSKVAFVADTSDTVAYATHVNLAVMQTSTTGIWGVGSGSSGTMTISPLITNASNAFLLGGSADGQTAYGGKEPGANMVLRSTTHATKGSVKIDETTGSASISTGALVVGGGVGVAQNLYVGGVVATDSIIGKSSAALYVGGTNSTSVNIASNGVQTSVLGPLAVNSIDRSSSGDLVIGGTTATSVTVGSTAGVVSMVGVMKYAVVDDSSTTAQSPLYAQLNPVTRFTGASSFTYTLPPVGSGQDGTSLTFYKTNASGTVTLISDSGNVGLIEGSTLELSNQYDRVSIMYMSTSDRWIIV